MALTAAQKRAQELADIRDRQVEPFLFLHRKMGLPGTHTSRQLRGEEQERDDRQRLASAKLVADNRKKKAAKLGQAAKKEQARRLEMRGGVGRTQTPID